MFDFSNDSDLAPKSTIVRFDGNKVFILNESSAYAARKYRKSLQENAIMNEKGEVVGVKPGILDAEMELLGDCLVEAIEDGDKVTVCLNKDGSLKRVGIEFIKNRLTERQRKALMNWVVKESDLLSGGATEEELENTIMRATEALNKLREGKLSGQNTT